MQFPIFQKLGGRDEALSLLSEALPSDYKHGKPTVDAVKFWGRKRVMPAKVVLAFMEICAQREIPFDQLDCRLPPRAQSSELADSDEKAA